MIKLVLCCSPDVVVMMNPVVVLEDVCSGLSHNPGAPN